MSFKLCAAQHNQAWVRVAVILLTLGAHSSDPGFRGANRNALMWQGESSLSVQKETTSLAGVALIREADECCNCETVKERQCALLFSPRFNLQKCTSANRSGKTLAFVYRVQRRLRIQAPAGVLEHPPGRGRYCNLLQSNRKRIGELSSYLQKPASRCA